MSPRPPRLTATEEQKIIELYTTKVNGRWPTTTSIAQQIGRSRTAVDNCVERAGISRHKPRMTEAEKQRAIDLYQTSTGTRWIGTPEIAEALGRSSTHILKVIAEAGINRTISEALSAHVPEDLRKTIIRTYRSLGSYPKVAEHLKIGSRVVYDVLNETGVIVRQGPNGRARIRAKEAKELVTLYRMGLSAREVAERTGRTRDVVTNLARDAGVLRSRREASQMAARRRAVAAAGEAEHSAF